MIKKEALKCVGKRVLTELKHSFIDNPFEIIVLELSPSGKYFHIMYPITGSKEWEEISEYTYPLLEILGDYKEEK